MKLVITIISNSDTGKVLEAVAQHSFFVTKISTTGQFLVDGHTAILIGCEDDRVEELYDVIKQNVTKRVVKSAGVTSTITGSLLNQAVDVEEFGGVMFTINVEEYKKF